LASAERDAFKGENGVHTLKLTGGAFVGAADLDNVVYAGQSREGLGERLSEVWRNGTSDSDGDVFVAGEP
jgi:hypothetical protein